MAHLLIVDDDANTLASLARAFRLAGHEATVCDQAARALELAKAQRFDMIFSDVVMPGKDVLALLEDLKAAGVSSPVVMISGQANVEMAVRASDALKREGIGVRVLNMHTIKPLDRNAILAAAVETGAIVTAEEHHLVGGLGGAVAELLAVEHPTRMRMVGMPDAFATVGPTNAVRAKYGMSAEGIVEACRAFLESKSIRS